MKVVAIIQARLTSVRFPEKVLQKINGKTLIEILLKRVKYSKEINKIIVAIPSSSENNKLFEFLKKKNVNIFRGSEYDVLDRYYRAAKKNSAKIVIRLTADNPLIDPNLIDEMIIKFKSSNVDFLSNSMKPYSYPNGFDVEIFTFDVLKKAWKNAKRKMEREHVTSYFIFNKKIKKLNYSYRIDYSKYRFTVDYPVDFELIKKLYKYFSLEKKFSWLNIVNLCKKNKKIFRINSNINRNSGEKTNDAQKLWSRAINKIPGGNMMISKHPDLYLPGRWPTYFSKAKGCSVWDLEGNKYMDVSSMGCGTNILGYGHKDVDRDVSHVVEKGNMTTLNCPEEVFLAEKILSINPWAQRALFVRTGGEANAIAVRLARAFTGKDKVAVCGYHGWHDWYLASGKEDEKKFRQDLPFYSTIGVPSKLRNSVLKFSYNNFNELKSLIDNNREIGIVKMEVIRNQHPRNNFLKKIRELTKKRNIVLIFDECTTGFRETLGGIHKKFNVNPDMAVYGKALGNGYAIASVVGKEKIMNMYNKTFISSTFWTERIGTVAALASLKVMERSKSWIIITKTGKKIMKKWKRLAKKNGLKIKILGIPSICSFHFLSKNNKEYINLITQTMLDNKILATTTIYVSIAHNSGVLDKYFSVLEKVFRIIRRCENGEDVYNYLKGPLSGKSFRKF